MKKNKFTIQLGDIELNDKQKLKALQAVRIALNLQPKPKKPKPVKGHKAPLKAASSMLTEAPAIITVKITNTEPGLSNISADHNGTVKTLKQGGEMKFQKVKAGDVIIVEGDSLGNVAFSIDRTAKPKEIKFEPLTIIAFSFDIKE